MLSADDCRRALQDAGVVVAPTDIPVIAEASGAAANARRLGQRAINSRALLEVLQRRLPVAEPDTASPLKAVAAEKVKTQLLVASQTGASTPAGYSAAKKCVCMPRLVEGAHVGCLCDPTTTTTIPVAPFLSWLPSIPPQKHGLRRGG